MAVSQATPAPLLLTVRDIQRRLQVGKNQAYRMMNDGTLPIVVISERKRYVPEAALRKWIKENTRQSA